MGACDQKTTEEILDFFYEQGGNFIDTSNNYQAEQSETWIGEWMAKRGVRDQMGKLPTSYSYSHMPIGRASGHCLFLITVVTATHLFTWAIGAAAL